MDSLQFFYLVSALFLLAVAIVVYPTLRERSKNSSKKKESS